MRVSDDKAELIYNLVREVPMGQVASYGMIASMLTGITARMVGSAMKSSPKGVPWQRIINSQGKISARDGAERQKVRLLDEGISFSASGRVNWQAHRWKGPSNSWLNKNSVDVLEFIETEADWPKA